jgi:hypothetical protein
MWEVPSHAVQLEGRSGPVTSGRPGAQPSGPGVARCGRSTDQRGPIRGARPWMDRAFQQTVRPLAEWRAAAPFEERPGGRYRHSSIRRPARQQLVPALEMCVPSGAGSTAPPCTSAIVLTGILLMTYRWCRRGRLGFRPGYFCMRPRRVPAGMYCCVLSSRVCGGEVSPSNADSR